MKYIARIALFFLAAGAGILLGATTNSYRAEGSHAPETNNARGWVWSGTTWTGTQYPVNPECINPSSGDVENLENCGGAGWGSVSSGNTYEGHNPNSPLFGLIIPNAGGNVLGQIYMSNVGWINFQPSGIPPASPDVGVRRDGNTLVGWAQIESIQTAADKVPPNNGGWEGWVKLSGTATGGGSYGVTINPATGALAGHAWSNELGWIDFSLVSIPPDDPGGSAFCRLTAAPPSITSGQNSTLSWDIQNIATSACTATNNWQLPPESQSIGSITVGPTETTTYGLNCDDGTTNTAACSVTVNVNPIPPASCRLSANPTNGPSPLSGSLTWTTQNNPISCIASGGWSGNQNPVGDSASYGPISDTTTYSLTCSNAMGQSGSCETTVVVTDLTVSCSGSPNLAPLTGGSVTVDWTGSILSPGTTPYTYSWTFDGNASPSSASSPSPSTVYTTAGQKNASLVVTDSANAQSSASCSVLVGKKGIWREILPFSL